MGPKERSYNLYLGWRVLSRFNGCWLWQPTDYFIVGVSAD